MELAMEGGGPSQVAVWVLGFYGSGKSSFTKYLGLALDESVKVDGVPFLDYLQGRLNKPQTRALLTKVARRFPAAVVLLDLASELSLLPFERHEHAGTTARAREGNFLNSRNLRV